MLVISMIKEKFFYLYWDNIINGVLRIRGCLLNVLGRLLGKCFFGLNVNVYEGR